MQIEPIRTFYLPSGRVILSKTSDDYLIESTEMRDISVDGKNHSEVRSSLDPHVIWKHTVDIKDKWLLTVSTQKGCVHNCKFCDVANLPFKGNLTDHEILNQIKMLVSTTPELISQTTQKAKIGFARMGEPAHNLTNVLNVIKYLKLSVWNKSNREEADNLRNKLYHQEFSDVYGYYINKYKNASRWTDEFYNLLFKINWLPCFNSILPRKTMDGMSGEDVVFKVIETKEKYCNGFLHFQISCNSTDETKRKELFGGADVLSLEEIIKIINKQKISNRTVTLNFIVMKNVPIDIDYLIKLGLNPQKFAVKLIPLNHTLNAESNSLETEYDYDTYDELKKYSSEFEKAGIQVVYDAVAKCETAGLCCGQLAHIFG